MIDDFENILIDEIQFPIERLWVVDFGMGSIIMTMAQLIAYLFFFHITEDQFQFL